MSQVLSGCAVRAVIQQESAKLPDVDRHYLVAIKGSLEQLYEEHPDDSRLREKISDEVSWLEEKLGIAE